MRDLDKAALSELNKILDGGDDDAVQALKAQIAAWEQAKALDDTNVQRKDAAPDAPAQDAKDKAEVKGEVDVKSEPPATPEPVKAEPTPPANAEKKAKPPKKEDMEEEMSEDGEDDEEEEVKPKKPKRGKAKTSEPMVADDLSDKVLKGITEYVDTRVVSTVEEQTKAINAALETLVEHLGALSDQLEALDRRDKALASTNEMQRGVAERMKALSAAMSSTTIIESSDPLATMRPAPASDDPLAIFRK